MSRILEIHDRVFEYLYRKHKEEKEKGKDFFFTMRRKKSDRLEKGYWFAGNDDYMSVSFWTGADALNRTSNIYFEIRTNGAVRIYFAVRDSIKKTAYFKELIQFSGHSKDAVELLPGLFCVYLTENHQDKYLDDLDLFVENEKIMIDTFIDTTLYISADDEVDTGEEFESKFGYISPPQFDKMLNQVLQYRARKIRTVAVEEITSPTNISPKSVLSNIIPQPFSIISFEIEDYQGIKSTSISNIPQDTQWIFITGENGFGKTSILQSICYGLSDNLDVEKCKNAGTKVFVEFVADATIHRNNAQEKNEPQSFYSINQNLVAYGPSRLELQAFNQRLDETQESSNTYNLFNTNGFLKNVEYSLIHLFKWNPKRYQLIVDCLIDILHGRISRIEVEKTGERVLYFEASENGETFEPVPFNHLAIGYRNIVALVGDLILRFSDKDPDINLSDISGIVLIDEIENHLHPKLQKDLVISLTRIFKKIQFVVSTHSPIPLLGAPSNSIILNVHRDFEKGINVERVNVDLANLLPNTILSSPIFDFSNITSINHKKGVKKINTEELYDEVLKNEQKKARLKEIAKKLGQQNDL